MNQENGKTFVARTSKINLKKFENLAIVGALLELIGKKHQNHLSKPQQQTDKASLIKYF